MGPLGVWNILLDTTSLTGLDNSNIFSFFFVSTNLTSSKNNFALFSNSLIFFLLTLRTVLPVGLVVLDNSAKTTPREYSLGASSITLLATTLSYFFCKASFEFLYGSFIGPSIFFIFKDKSWGVTLAPLFFKDSTSGKILSLSGLPEP